MSTPTACRAPRAWPKRIRASREARKGSIVRSRRTCVLEARKKGQIDGLIVRLPDFYGPGADNSLANPIFRAALAGKTANWIGPVNTPHEFVFVPDTGPVIVGSRILRRVLRPGLEFRRPGRDQLARFHHPHLPCRRARAQIPHRRAAACSRSWAGSARSCASCRRCFTWRKRPSSWTTANCSRSSRTRSKTSYDEGILRTIDWIKGA